MLENASYLDDLLGVTIGFATIMLLLSLVVTAVVQALQSILRIRLRNLSLGVYAVLEPMLREKLGVAAIEKNEISLKTIKDEILAFLSKSFAWIKRFLSKKTPIEQGSSVEKAADRINIKTIKKEILVSPLRKFAKMKWFFPKKTWIEPDDLVEAVERVYEITLNAFEAEKLKKKFMANYTYLSKRFSYILKYWTFAVALIVALVFQVDSLDLLRRLSADPQLQAKLEMSARGLTEEGIEKDLVPISHREVSDSALALLQIKHPILAPKLKQASGVGENRAEVINKLGEILKGEKPELSRKIREGYEENLDDLHLAAIDSRTAKIEKYSDMLGLFNIKPLNQDWSYYCNWGHLFGILITTIFLTFGAPFWFERLRELIKLKDMLKPDQKNKE